MFFFHAENFLVVLCGLVEIFDVDRVETAEQCDQNREADRRFSGGVCLRQRTGGLARETVDVLLECLDALSGATDAIESDGLRALFKG